MKQTKVTLANVLLIIAAICFGFACYLSINFLTLGDSKKSLLGAVIITFVIAGLAFIAQLLKKTNKKFKTCFIFEMLVLLLFIGAAFIFIQPFSHVFTVFQNKESIENSVIDNIDQSQKMFDSYEQYAADRKRDYEAKLNAIVASKSINPTQYKSCGFDSIRSDSKQINTKIFTLNAKLIPSNYTNPGGTDMVGIKEAAVIWLDNASRNVKGDFSFMFGIVNILNQVPVKINEWKGELISLSEYRSTCEPQTVKDFDYPLNFQDVKSQLTEVKSPTILSVVLAVLAYLLMLLPYILAKRSTKAGSIVELLFGSKNSSDKEL